MSWSFAAPAFQKTHSVWAVDLPGHGVAGNDVGSGLVEDLSEAVKREIIETISGPIALLAHSLGGAVAIQLAHDSDIAVSQLVLLAPAGVLPLTDTDFVSGFSKLESVDTISKHLKRAVRREKIITNSMADYVRSSLQTAGRRRALEKLASAATTSALIPEIRHDRLTCIWGEDDTIIKPDQPRLTALFDDLHMLPNIGHLPHLEATQKVCRIAQAALAAMGSLD